MSGQDQKPKKPRGIKQKIYTDEELKENRRARNKRYYEANKERLNSLRTENYRKSKARLQMT